MGTRAGPAAPRKRVPGSPAQVPSQWPSDWLSRLVVTPRTVSLVLTASLGSSGPFCFNVQSDQEQSALLEPSAVTKPCQGASPCPFPPHSCFLFPKKAHTPARGAASLPPALVLGGEFRRRGLQQQQMLFGFTAKNFVEFPKDPQLVRDRLRSGARTAQDGGRRPIPQHDWQDWAENRSRELQEGKGFSSLLDRDAAEWACDQRTVQTKNYKETQDSLGQSRER